MYDSVLQYSELACRRSSILRDLRLQSRGYALATVHRAENTDDPKHLRDIFRGLLKVAASGLSVIVPLHPRTKKALSSLSPVLEDFGSSLRIIDPVSYLDMILLEKNARVILTDSGGVQKEAFFFKVPCVTLRAETEWVETIETGWNVLVGCDPEEIARAALHSKAGDEGIWPYGDGRVAERIIGHIAMHCNTGFR